MMLLFGVFCLVSFAAALPAPDSSEILSPVEDLHTNVAEPKPEEQEPEILSPIPPPPELPPLVILELDKPENEDVEKLDSREKNEEDKYSEKEPEENVSSQESIVVPVEQNIAPSLISTIFSNLSWPSFPTFQFPTFSFPFALPSFFGGTGRQVAYPYTYYPNPNYRYIVVQ